MKNTSLLVTIALLFAAPLAHADFIATVNGTITSGCDDCDGNGISLFGLGAAADLTGLDFQVEIYIKDALFEQPPLDFERAPAYFPGRTGRLTASVTVNQQTYELPYNSYSLTNLSFPSDGSVGLYLVNEYYDPTRIFHYDTLSGSAGPDGAGTLGFGMHQDQTGQGGAGLHTRSGFQGQFDGYEVRAVPEPSTAALMGLGLLMLGCRRKRLMRA